MKYNLKFFTTESPELTTVHGILAACGTLNKQAVIINFFGNTTMGPSVRERVEPRFVNRVEDYYETHKIQSLSVVKAFRAAFNDTDSTKDLELYTSVKNEFGLIEVPKYLNYFLLGFLSFENKNRPITQYVYDNLRDKYPDIVLNNNRIESNYMDKILLDLWYETYV